MTGPIAIAGNCRDIEAAPPIHVLGGYRAWRLAGAHAQLCDMAWINSPRTGATERHRVLPLGEPSLALRRRWSRDGALETADIIVCGPHKNPFWNEADAEIIAVRLKPELAGAALALAPAEFLGSPQTQLDPRAAAQFETTRANEAASTTVVVRALLRDIAAISQARLLSVRPEQFAAARLRSASGAGSIREIAADLSVSERHLRRRFRDTVGCSPKDYARRLRIAAAAIAADGDAQPRWAEIAAGAGYHDQSHMIAEFRALVGLTPAALHAERRAEAD